MALRVIVMSDIHGNLAALRAVVDSLPEHDAVIVAGDHCIDGPKPAEVLDMLRELGWTLLIGNTDEEVAMGPRAGDSETKAALIEWTRRQLGESRLHVLGALPFSARITADGGATPVLGSAPDSPNEEHPANLISTDSDLLLAVHANPRNVDDQLHPTLSEQELRPYLDGMDARILAFGHLHTPYVRPVGDALLIDVSSVGHPKDRDLRASYTLVSWDNGSRTVSQIRVPYDVEETVHGMRQSGMPHAEKHIASLLKASY